MAEASSEPEGPDFEKGFNIDDVADGKMLLRGNCCAGAE